MTSRAVAAEVIWTSIAVYKVSEMILGWSSNFYDPRSHYEGKCMWEVFRGAGVSGRTIRLLERAKGFEPSPPTLARWFAMQDRGATISRDVRPRTA